MPEVESLDSLFAEHLSLGDTTLVDRESELLVDIGVVEADASGVELVVAVEYVRYVSPVDSAEAHRARFAGGVDDSALEVVRAGVCGSVSDSHDFSVGGRVVVGGYSVDASAEDKTVLDDDSAEGASAVLDIFGSHLYGFSHILFFHVVLLDKY